MAEFGFWELALVMLVALLIVGPDRLPQVAAQIGRWMGKIRRMAQSFKDELSDEAGRDTLYKTLGDRGEDIQQIGKELKKTGDEINREIRDLDPLAQSIERQIEDGRFTSPDSPDDALEEHYDTDEKKPPSDA